MHLHMTVLTFFRVAPHFRVPGGRQGSPQNCIPEATEGTLQQAPISAVSQAALPNQQPLLGFHRAHGLGYMGLADSTRVPWVPKDRNRDPQGTQPSDHSLILRASNDHRFSLWTCGLERVGRGWERVGEGGSMPLARRRLSDRFAAASTRPIQDPHSEASCGLSGLV